MHYLDNAILCFLSILLCFLVSILAIIFRERKFSQKQLQHRFVCAQFKNIERRFEPRDGDSVRTR